MPEINIVHYPFLLFSVIKPVDLCQCSLDVAQARKIIFEKRQNILHGYIASCRKFLKNDIVNQTELHTVVFSDANLPLASAPPSWSHLYEQAEQAQPRRLRAALMSRCCLATLKL